MAPYSGRARGGAAGQSKSSGAPQKSPQASSSNIVQDQSSTSKTPYFSQLQSLRELFSESWNDDDLIAVLQEVNGDLEIAIARISEGHAEQWSKQASKKEKKVKKEPSAVPASAGSALPLDRPPRQISSAKPSGVPTRGGLVGTRGRGRGRGRGGRAMGDSRRPQSGLTQDSSANATAWASTEAGELDSRPFGAPLGEASESKSESWGDAAVANVTSAPLASQGAGAWGNTAEPAAKPSGAAWGSASNESNVKATKPAPNASSSWKSGPSGDSGSGWADSTISAQHSGAKKPIAPSSLQAAAPQSKPVSGKSTWAQIAKPEPPKVVQPIQTQAPKPVPQQRQPSPARAASPARPSGSAAGTSDHGKPTQVAVPKLEEASVSQLDEQSAPPGFAKAAASGRGVASRTSMTKPKASGKGEAPVVMPTNASVSNAGVQFGSLSLAEDAEKKERANAMERQSPVAAVGVSAARTTGANASSAPSATPHYLKDQQQVAAASYQQHVNPAYSGAESANGPNGVSYGYPAQVPSSFNMGPMGGMSAADYNSAYGSDAQRMMGYYADPSSYQQHASANVSNAGSAYHRDSKFGQQQQDATSNPSQAHATSGANVQQQQQSQQPAQGYPPMNAALANLYGAYFPYYMNQFPGASPYGSSVHAGHHPAAGYGHQPFGAKTMYPMYPTGAPAVSASGATGKPAAASTAGVYGGYPSYGMGNVHQVEDNAGPSSGASTGHGGAASNASSSQDYAKYAGASSQGQQQPFQSFLNQVSGAGSNVNAQSGKDMSNQGYKNQGGDKSASGNAAANAAASNQSAAAAAYYSQFMHPAAAGFPNFMAAQHGHHPGVYGGHPGVHQHPAAAQQHQQVAHQQGASGAGGRAQYWGGSQS